MIWEKLEARGLNIEALSGKGWVSHSEKDGGESIAIPFMRNGVQVGEKFRRFDGQGMKWRAQWEAGPIAYNEDCLRDPALKGKPLIITEGEMDCEAALLSGFEKTISVPNGCGGASGQRDESEVHEAKAYSWLHQIEPLLRKDSTPEIILAVDGDEAGGQLLHELSLLLGKARCRFLVYPKTRRDQLGRERCKDLNEVLHEYGVKGVRNTLERAEFMKVKGVFKMSELPPLPSPTIYEIGFKLLGENYKMRLGDFCVITGVPGFGKTSFVNDVCCRVADQYGVKVAWASFEQAPQRDHKRALRSWKTERLPRHWDADMIMAADKWIDDHHVFIVPDEDDDPTLEWLLTCLEGAVVQHGAQIVVVDPWNELEHVRDHRENETEYIGRAIRTLKRFAKAFQVHIILVAHPAKLQKVNGKYLIPSLYEISGSANFYNKADIGIVVHREDADTTTIKVQKSRYHDIIGKPGEVQMEFCMDDRRFRENQRLA